jgi:hypothetical protein
MIGVDGKPMSQEYYRCRALEECLSSSVPLTFDTKPAEPSIFPSVTGAAAKLLFADIAGAEMLEARRKIVLAASTRCFLDALQTPKGLAELLESTAFRPSRFDPWVKEPSDVAFKLGAVCWMAVRDFVIKAAHLVFAGETARVSAGSNFAMHNAFTQIEGIASVENWPELFAESAQLALVFGTTMIAPTRDRRGFNILYWDTSYRSPTVLRVFEPAEIARFVIEDNRRERAARISLVPEDYQIRADSMVDQLVRHKSFTGTDFINLVLPLEFQIVLAYEGLYQSHTGKRRSANPTVTFAGSGEDVSTAAWSDLYNNLVAQREQKELVPAVA